MKQINRVDRVEDLRVHIEKNIPCVYVPSTEGRYSIQEVSLAWITAHFGANRVTVRHSRSGNYIDPAADFVSLVQALCTKKCTIREFLREGTSQKMILSGTDTYIYHQGKAQKSWEHLWAYAQHLVTGEEAIFLQEHLHTVGLWISGKGIRSITHYDDSTDNNLNVQIMGSKRFLLFPPQDWPHLKTFLAMSLHDFSWFSSFDEDGKTKKTNITPYDVTLKKGEILYIPSCWYHFVTHKGAVNINMTYWFSCSFEEEQPKQSCRDVFLILKLILAFLMSILISSMRQLYEWITKIFS